MIIDIILKLGYPISIIQSDKVYDFILKIH